jgi:glyoxylase-like metal-dependent hydrolase (beta-lactamase superfamily II)
VTLRIDTFVLGPLMTNCYVLRWDGQCWVVDPSLWPDDLLGFLHRTQVQPGRILLTHGHGDHIAGVADLKAAYPQARLGCPAGDAYMLGDPEANASAAFGVFLTCPPPDDLLQAGQCLQDGDLTWRILDTSGHTPGGVSFHCPDEQVVITGDALFQQGIGRTDIPGADERKLLRNIRDNLLSLPDDTRVLPGHGPQTTIGAERRGNPFLQERV